MSTNEFRVFRVFRVQIKNKEKKLRGVTEHERIFGALARPCVWGNNNKNHKNPAADVGAVAPCA